MNTLNAISIVLKIEETQVCKFTELPYVYSVVFLNLNGQKCCTFVSKKLVQRTENTIESFKVPDAVLSTVRRAINSIKEWNDALTRSRRIDQMFHGEGRYASDCFNNRPSVQQFEERLNTFRELAGNHNISASKVLKELGYEPALELNSKEKEWIRAS